MNFQPIILEAIERLQEEQPDYTMSQCIGAFWKPSLLTLTDEELYESINTAIEVEKNAKLPQIEAKYMGPPSGKYIVGHDPYKTPNVVPNEADLALAEEYPGQYKLYKKQGRKTHFTDWFDKQILVTDNTDEDE